MYTLLGRSAFFGVRLSSECSTAHFSRKRLWAWLNEATLHTHLRIFLLISSVHSPRVHIILVSRILMSASMVCTSLLTCLQLWGLNDNTLTLLHLYIIILNVIKCLTAVKKWKMYILSQYVETANKFDENYPKKLIKPSPASPYYADACKFILYDAIFS